MRHTNRYRPFSVGFDLGKWTVRKNDDATHCVALFTRPTRAQAQQLSKALNDVYETWVRFYEDER